MMEKIKTFIFEWSLYFSSYTPLLILIYLKQCEEQDKEWNQLWKVNTVFWIISLVIVLISFLLFLFWIKGNSNAERKYEEIKPINNDVLNYFITYLIPLVSLDVTNKYSIIMNVLLFLIIGKTQISSNSFHMNILLILMGYQVYSAKNNYILFSRNNLENEDVIYYIKSIGTTNFNVIHEKKDSNKLQKNDNKTTTDDIQ